MPDWFNLGTIDFVYNLAHAVLSPIDDVLTDRLSGDDAGKVVIRSDFDNPLPEFD